MEQMFNMAATAQAFDILSNNLYSNPKLAIIRELSTNANDSSIASKTDKPFDLHLPTQNEPFFNIRDYGEGIPEDLIYNIYTSYFVSTKTEDESQTGCFGLGSKTPFSLVDKYTVISYCEGKKKTYKMEKKNGLPTVEKISEEDTNEDTGLEINFKVDHSYAWEFDEWEKEARNFFKGTSFMPNVNVFNENEYFDWEQFAKEREFYSLDSLEVDGGRYNPEITVNVAGVNFNVNVNDLRAKGEELQKDMRNAGVGKINIMAGKSDVSLTPSREVLHYDEKTIDFIYTRVKNSIDNYFKSISENFDEIKYEYALQLQNNQKYDTDLNERLKEKVLDTFFQKALDVRRGGRGATIDVQSPNSNYASWRYNKFEKIFLVDFNGIESTVKQNVVDNFMALQSFNENGKLTSTSFADVVKRIDPDCNNYRVIFPKDYKDEANLKAAKDFCGENVKVIKWADICDYKKEAGSSGRKLGFKTRQTINYEKGKYRHYGYSSTPDLDADETGVIITELEATQYDFVDSKIKILEDLGVDYKIAIRPCKDTVFKKYKDKGFQTLKEYVDDVVKANTDTIRDEAIKAKKVQWVRQLSWNFNKGLFDLINLPCYDELEEIEDFKNMRELYKEENFVDQFKVSLSKIEGIEGIPDYKKIDFADFPLYKWARIGDVESWKAFLDYALVYKDSVFFRVEKKLNEEVA